MKRTTLYSILFLSSVFISAQARAATEGTSETRMDHVRGTEGRSAYEPHIGLLAGYSDLNGIPAQDASYLLDVGYQPFYPITAALQFQYTPGQIEVPGPDIDYNTWGLYLKGTTTLGGEIPFVRNIFVGGKTGIVNYNGDFDSKTFWSIGPTAGFDIPVNTAGTFTLGAEGTYLGVVGNDFETPDQVTVVGSAKVFF